MPRANNPPWTRDELILALDVYLRHGAVDKKHAAVAELSDLLQWVGPRSQAGDPAKFRNPNGVGMKIGNFMAVDPSSPAEGLAHGGRKAEQAVWDEFTGQPDELVAEVARIKAQVDRSARGAEPAGTVDLVEGAARLRRRGQGFMSDIRSRQAIERRAVQLATEHFEGEGWSVEDVGATESYDLRCHRADVELHAEVKGTTGAGAAVTLTGNEVRHAERYEHVALVVVSHVRVTTSTEPVASGGTVVVHYPWRLDRSRLRARAYEYEVPEPPSGTDGDTSP